MYFSHISLTNWKNFQQAKAELPQRVFLVGPNASGKSNFLDAFRFLRDLARPGGGLQNACDVRGGVSKIRCLAARSVPGVELQITLSQNPDMPADWQYIIAFTQETQFPRKGTPILLKEQVFHNGELILDRPNEDDKQDPLRLTQTALEQITFNQDFRPLSEFLSTTAYLHLVPQIVRDLRLSSDPNIPDMYGSNFLENIANTPQRNRDARLKRILKALKIAVPQLEDMELIRDAVGAPHLEVRYKHWRSKPAKQNETQLSDGTLRLIALLWLLEDGAGTLLLEEPELSLHSELIKRLANLIYRANKKKRQMIISTHSADLLSDQGISGHEILMFAPSDEGTLIKVASSDEEVRTLLETGLPISEVVLPKTSPENIGQLALVFW